jgi:hypothetical protein
MSTRALFRWLLSGALIAGAAACSGDGFQASGTVVTGLIVLPSAQNCDDCQTQQVEVQVLGLVENGDSELLKTVTTNGSGVYNTGDISAELAEFQASQGIQADQQSFIIVAEVNDSGAEIGGIISARLGATGDKTFNPTTHIACQGAVYLTAGTTNAEAGCVVLPTCEPGQPNCLQTVDANTLDDTYINNLEQAASYISADILFPEEVPSAACAVLLCTDGGAEPGSQECVRSALGLT